MRTAIRQPLLAQNLPRGEISGPKSCFPSGPWSNAWLGKDRGPSGGMVDAGDSKSPAGDSVPVRVRPWVPTKTKACSVFLLWAFVLKFISFHKRLPQSRSALVLFRTLAAPLRCVGKSAAVFQTVFRKGSQCVADFLFAEKMRLSHC